MNYDKLKTDELVEIVVTKTGLPLPTYDYSNYRKYITVVPENIPFGDGVTGIENADMHDTFREGCIRLISWYSKEINKI